MVFLTKRDQSDQSIIGGSDEIEFRYDEDTSVLESCSLVIENRMFILGGVYDEGRVPKNAHLKVDLSIMGSPFTYKKGTNQFFDKQISEVTKCSLTKKSELPFRFTNGGCSNVNDHEVLLCFSFDSPKDIIQFK